MAAQSYRQRSARTPSELIGALAAIALSGLLLLIDLLSDRQDELLNVSAILGEFGAAAAIFMFLLQQRRNGSVERETVAELASLEGAKAAAESANRAKSRYLAGVSHEVRSPLNAIYGYAQLLERSGGVDPREAGRAIGRSVEHLINLVEGLLDIAQLEYGVLRIRNDEVNLRAFLDQIAAIMRPEARAKNLAFVYDSPAHLPDLVRMDQSRVRQVLINLLINAIKFTQRGSVNFSVRYAGQIVTFEIRDTGPGIAPEDQQRIFEPFQQGADADGTAGPQGRLAPQGAGLGLAIARTIVEILGGKMELESELGVGTCFRVKLMLSEVSGRLTSAASTRRRCGYEGGDRALLLVEDDKDQRLVLERLLQSVGFKVQVVDNGEAALALLATEMSDLVLMDLSLPGMSGLEASAQIREQLGDRIRIVMLSANSEERVHAHSKARPYDRFFVKPAEFETLIETIGELLSLTWTWDAHDQAETPQVLSVPAAKPPFSEHAWQHIARMKEYLRIGYVRGLDHEIEALEKAAPDAAHFTGRLSDCLHRYDLARMARLLEDM